MKKKRITILSKLAVLFFLFCFAECDMDYEQDGRDAANAFCNCLDEGNSTDKCEEKLKSKYNKSTYTDSDFKKGFDEAGNKCGIKWEITKW